MLVMVVMLVVIVLVNVFAVVFTILGNKVFHTLDGSLGLLIWNALVSAAAASGDSGSR